MVPPGRGLAGVALALALGGCGVEVVHEEARTPRPPSAVGPAAAAPRPVAQPAGAGTVPTERRVSSTLAGTLQLPELTVHLVGQTVRIALPSNARAADARFTFVLLQLDVVNRSARAVRFGRPVRAGRRPQVVLQVGGRFYPEFQRAERDVPDGFARQRPLRPGELRTGGVAFVSRAPSGAPCSESATRSRSSASPRPAGRCGPARSGSSGCTPSALSASTSTAWWGRPGCRSG